MRLSRGLKALIAIALVGLVGSCVLPLGAEAEEQYDYIAKPGDRILLPDMTVILVGGEPSAPPTQTPDPTAVPTPTAAESESPSPTPEPTPEPTVSPSPSPTPSPVISPSVEPTASPSPSPTSSTPPPSPTPSPTPEPSVEPSSSPSPRPSTTPSATPPAPTATPSPTSAPTGSPVPTASPSATPSATPTPTPPPPPTGDFIGPEPGSASAAGFAAVKAAADASPGSPDITCNQNQRAHPGAALASALVYAATGNETYRARAEALIEAAYPTARSCGNSILSLGRQLGAYVLAADYIGYRDPDFVRFVETIRTRDLDGHSRWYTLAGTATDSSNNWGTFALASLTAADLYLQDQGGIARDYSVWRGYGDGSWPFRKTGGYLAGWTCGDYEAIEQEHCGSPDRNGAPVEDASRNGSTSSPHAGYVNEAMQGYTVTMMLLRKAGYDSAAVNEAQFCRAAAFQMRFGIANGHSTGYYAAWAVRKYCAPSSYPLPSNANFGRVFGFTNWLVLP